MKQPKVIHSIQLRDTPDDRNIVGLEQQVRKKRGIVSATQHYRTMVVESHKKEFGE